jgi:hypothetical protein
MIEPDDEIYENNGIKGILKYLTRHLFWIVVADILMFLPCYLCGLVVLNMED